MNTTDYKNFPRCLFDHPLEITPGEIASLSGPINILLKSSYLLGTSRDLEGTFQSLFDIAEEISDVDSCTYLSWSSYTNTFEAVATRGVPSFLGDDHTFLTPADLTRHSEKVIHIDSKIHQHFLPVCKSWNCSSLVAFPLHREREFVGSLIFGNKKNHSLSPVQIKLLWILAIQAENLLLQCEAVKTLSFYSFLDPLTHLYNRRYFDNQIEKEILRSRRNGKPIALLMLDLDGFKSYNDRFHHAAGDVALQEIASILHDSVREVDTVARFGGDEFAIILFESSADGGRDLAHRIIERIGKHLLPGMDNIRSERLTACAGVATFPSDSFDKEDLLRKADRALYVAKSQGGSKVCVFHEIADLLSAKPSPNDIPLQKIFDAARSVVDMDKFLEILLFTAMQGLSAGRGSIVVTDTKGDFTLRAAIGFNNGENQVTPGAAIVPGPVTSWVLTHKVPLVVTGQADMPMSKRLQKNGYRTESFLSIPLVHEGRLLGALHLTNRMDKQAFTKDDLAAFEPISNEIARVLYQGIEFRENVKSFSTSILQSLSSALEIRYPFLLGHSGRVRDLCMRVGRRLQLGQDDLSALETAASLHDIGIVGIPGIILSKRKRLNDRELQIIRKHPFLGAKLLEGIPGLEEIRRVILEHHEFFDGSGYPYGLRGEEISPASRILSVAEFYDSITSERPHRGGLRSQEAIQLLKTNMETLFDPSICCAFIEEIQSGGNGEPLATTH
ncbi:MAG: diguanylate cyclase [Deltaproteobacteria bacterium]|nr:diguanylate cyclase [Deltaproteobacteria bacterium]